MDGIPRLSAQALLLGPERRRVEESIRAISVGTVVA
jgi:hypothetical protein